MKELKNDIMKYFENCNVIYGYLNYYPKHSDIGKKIGHFTKGGNIGIFKAELQTDNKVKLTYLDDTIKIIDVELIREIDPIDKDTFDTLRELELKRTEAEEKVKKKYPSIKIIHEYSM